jgi:hypothetical protein
MDSFCTTVRLLLSLWKKKVKAKTFVAREGLTSDVLIREVTTAFEWVKMNVSKKENTYQNILALFHQQLQQNRPESYSILVEFFLPSELLLEIKPPYHEQVAYKQFVQMLNSLEKKKNIRDQLAIRSVEDRERLLQAKQRQLELDSDTLWPFLSDQFQHDLESFRHYAKLLSMSIQFLASKHTSLVFQSIPWEEVKTEKVVIPAPAPALIRELESAIHAPSGAGKRKKKKESSSTTTTSTGPVGSPPPESEDLLIPMITPQGTTPPSFESFAYGNSTNALFLRNEGREENLFASNYGKSVPKTILAENPLLRCFPPVEELERELKNDSFLPSMISQSESTSYSSTTTSWQTRISTNILHPDRLTSFLGPLLTKHCGFSFTPDALVVVSEGIQMHLRNIVEAAWKVNEGIERRMNPPFLPTSRDSILSSCSLFGYPRFGPKRERDSDEVEEGKVVWAEIATVEEARKEWRQSGSLNAKRANVSIPILSTPHFPSLAAAAMHHQQENDREWFRTVMEREKETIDIIANELVIRNQKDAAFIKLPPGIHPPNRDAAFHVQQFESMVSVNAAATAQMPPIKKNKKKTKRRLYSESLLIVLEKTPTYSLVPSANRAAFRLEQ